MVDEYSRCKNVLAWRVRVRVGVAWHRPAHNVAFWSFVAAVDSLKAPAGKEQRRYVVEF